MDADDAGRQLADAIEKAFHDASRADLTFRRQEPTGFKDWNDQLRARRERSKVWCCRSQARPA
jgi:hypothetical protein